MKNKSSIISLNLKVARWLGETEIYKYYRIVTGKYFKNKFANLLIINIFARIQVLILRLEIAFFVLEILGIIVISFSLQIICHV